jgi:hypothetical protein
MENLLYYPYINLPRSGWSVRALLYYNNIGAIVPQNYFYDPDQYDPFMRELVRNELVIPIDPMVTLQSPWEVAQVFTNYMRGQETKLEQRRYRFSAGPSWRDLPSRSRIHANKFDGQIFYELQEAGLAQRENDDWYFVEKKTANELMTFLASVVGQKLDYLPVTDSYKKTFSMNNRSKSIFKTIKKEKQKRELILEELIPFPENIDLSQLRSFKDQHPDLLTAFKNKVELIALNPGIEEDSDFFRESIRELNLRKLELSAKMGESKLGNIFFGTVCGIAGAVYGFSTAETIGAVVGGLPGFVNAIHSAVQIERPESIADQSGNLERLITVVY